MVILIKCATRYASIEKYVQFFSAMLIQFAFIKQFTRFSAKKWLLHEELINSRFRGEDEEEEGGHRVLDEGVEEDLFATLLRSSDGIKRVLDGGWRTTRAGVRTACGKSSTCPLRQSS